MYRTQERKYITFRKNNLTREINITNQKLRYEKAVNFTFETISQSSSTKSSSLQFFTRSKVKLENPITLKSNKKNLIALVLIKNNKIKIQSPLSKHLTCKTRIKKMERKIQNYVATKRPKNQNAVRISQ